jgi:hypothetical protein
MWGSIVEEHLKEKVMGEVSDTLCGGGGGRERASFLYSSQASPARPSNKSIMKMNALFKLWMLKENSVPTENKTKYLHYKDQLVNAV